MSGPTFADYGTYPVRRTSEQPAREAGPPIVSVITIARNAAGTIARTIRSVHSQTFPFVEQIFVDGRSDDGTGDIIRSFLRPTDYMICEEDLGISDAFNKGIALARGRYVQILNADDWLSPNQIEVAVAAIEEAEADFVFGDLIFYDEDQPIFTYAGDPAYNRVINRRMPAIGHPTVLATRRCFERIGLFDLAYRNAMDYDWLLRLHCAGGRGIYRPEIIAHMTHAGLSNRQFRRTVEEVRAIAVAHGRNRITAALEANFQYCKIAASQPIKKHAKPLYNLIRRSINRSYRPLAVD